MRPGDGLLHPVACGSLALLIVNDHALKRAWPSVVTGKLSDLAGLVFFPLLLEALYEVTWGRARRMPHRAVLWWAVAATGLVFTLAKTCPPVNDGIRTVDGMLRYPVELAMAWARKRPSPPLGRPAMVLDPTDLLALPALGCALAIGRARRQKALTAQ